MQLLHVGSRTLPIVCRTSRRLVGIVELPERTEMAIGGTRHVSSRRRRDDRPIACFRRSICDKMVIPGSQQQPLLLRGENGWRTLQ